MLSKVILAECDNPECDFEEVINPDDEMATGYTFGSGKALQGPAGVWVLGGGGPIPPFYAHREECILPAFKAVMARRD